MLSNEMILTPINIVNVAKFIKSTHYRKLDSEVIFYNTPLNHFDYDNTKAKLSNLVNDCFESVTIKIGTIVYVK